MPVPVAGALEGIRVLDLTTEMGQYCGKLFADLGADVIKVEPPGGDIARGVSPFFRNQIGRSTSLSYWYFNTSKRSVTCDLDQHDGQYLLRSLIMTADILLESFAPSYMEDHNIGPNILLELRPELIYVSITGFGRDGPHAGWQATDIVALAMSGVMTLAGQRPDPPNTIAGSQAYISASLAAAQGALIALYHREHGGKGQLVEVSAQEALSMAQETAMQFWDLQQVARERSGSKREIGMPGVGTYETKDGHIYCNVALQGFGADWPVLIEWMEAEGKADDLTKPENIEKLEHFDLRVVTSSASDPSTLDAVRVLFEHTDELLSKFFASKTTHECYEQGQARRLFIGRVSTPKDVVEDVQLLERNWFSSLEHGEDSVVYPGPPYRLSSSPAHIYRCAPDVGQHNLEVWSEVGISNEDLIAYRSEGAI